MLHVNTVSVKLGEKRYCVHQGFSSLASKSSPLPCTANTLSLSNAYLSYAITMPDAIHICGWKNEIHRTYVDWVSEKHIYNNKVLQAVFNIVSFVMTSSEFSEDLGLLNPKAKLDHLWYSNTTFCTIENPILSTNSYIVNQTAKENDRRQQELLWS